MKRFKIVNIKETCNSRLYTIQDTELKEIIKIHIDNNTDITPSIIKPNDKSLTCFYQGNKQNCTSELIYLIKTSQVKSVSEILERCRFKIQSKTQILSDSYYITIYDNRYQTSTFDNYSIYVLDSKITINCIGEKLYSNSELEEIKNTIK